jgi:hypothetical protein
MFRATFSDWPRGNLITEGDLVAVDMWGEFSA